MSALKFDVGKQYKHTAGAVMSVVAKAETRMWGDTLLAEVYLTEGGPHMHAVGSDAGSAENWKEISINEFEKSASK